MKSEEKNSSCFLPFTLFVCYPVLLCQSMLACFSVVYHTYRWTDKKVAVMIKNFKWSEKIQMLRW